MPWKARTNLVYAARLKKFFLTLHQYGVTCAYILAGVTLLLHFRRFERKKKDPRSH